MTETILKPRDADLLTEYVRTGSKSAFEQIVNQHIHLVHAAAMRQVRNAHLAEDVTQAVFLLLWQRAESIATHASLGGWLLVTTHFISANAMKKERRLKHREQKAAQMNHEQGPSSPSQTDPILPLLDSAMAQLGDADRDAIVERFFHSRSLDEVGIILGISQQAAAKRVSRAVEKLRGILARRGVNTSDAMLGALLPAVALQPGASPSLLSTVLAGPTAAVSANVAALARTAVRPWSALLTKIAACGLVMLGLGGIAYLAVVLQGTPAASPPVAAAPQPPAAVAPAQLPAAAGRRTVTLLLVDAKTNAPLAGGQVELDVDGSTGPSRPAGPDGKYVLYLTGNYDFAHVICRAPGRVAMYLDFQNYTFKGDLPADYIIPMEPGTTIGGIVTNDIGNPLAGATVHVSTHDTANGDRPRVWLDEIAVTDAAGKWHIDTAPAQPEHLSIEVKHHDYSQSSPYRTISESAADELRRGVYETAMGTAVSEQICGIVLDPDGKAVQDARVVIANDYHASNKPTTLTDADGKFALAAPKIQWDTYATVTAKGFAPEQVKIPGTGQPQPDAKADAKPLEIRLSRPVKLEGTIVDGNGKPLRGVIVQLEQWRQNRALKWSTTTDHNGYFIWKEAPADTVQLDVIREDMALLTDVKVTPGGAPIQLKLFPRLRITGNVVDADTKEPIPVFRIVEGIRWAGQHDVTWQSQRARKLGNGKYKATIDSFANGGKLRVEADGYFSADSRMIEGNEGSIQIDFELKKGASPTGVVLAPDEKPLSDVPVACVPEGVNLLIDLDRNNLTQESDVILTKTDKNGRFTLPPQNKKFSLLVIADEGFVLISSDQLAKDGQIHLQKWARIEGDYRINASPAKFVKIGAEAAPKIGTRDLLRIETGTTTTDADGHFMLDRVPPVQRIYVHHLVWLSSTVLQFVPIANCKTIAGQTTTLHAGGNGRPVIGKLSLPATTARPVDYAQQVSLDVSKTDDVNAAMLRLLPYPENFPDLPQDQQRQWTQAQIANRLDKRTEAQKAQELTNQRIDFVIRSDGTMRVDNVEPGTYRGNAQVRNPLVTGSDDTSILGRPISFTVPTTPATPTDEPLDLGVIRLGPPSSMKIGKPLPSVQFIALDGQTVDPSAWAGKIVVMHFWEMHARKFFPAIEQLADQATDDPRIQIVNVGMQMLPAWAKHINAHDHLPGLLVLDKDSSELDSTAAYMDDPWMVDGLPFVLILDAQGNVTAKVSDVKDLSAAVDKAAAK